MLFPLPIKSQALSWTGEQCQAGSSEQASMHAAVQVLEHVPINIKRPDVNAQRLSLAIIDGFLKPPRPRWKTTRSSHLLKPFPPTG